MKLKLPTGLILGILIISLNTYGQISIITISGNIDSAITNRYKNKEIIIKLNQTANYFDQSEILKVEVNKNGTFKKVIDSKKPYLYLSFWIVNKNDEFQIGLVPVYFPAREISKLQEVYLFEIGDNIEMDIRDNGYIKFKGRGSEKLNCQFQMYSIDHIPAAVIRRKANLPIDRAIYFENSVLDLTNQIRLRILDSYKTDLNSKVYNLLTVDAMASSEYQRLSGLSLRYKPTLDESNIETLQKSLTDNIKKKNNVSIDSNLMFESAFYADMLFERELNTSRLYNSEDSYSNDDSFERIYKRLKRNYTGKLRDKLLFICFQKMEEQYPIESKQFIDDALRIMQTEYKNSLKTWASKKFMAYPFELQDAYGKTHKLSDYKGKVLVIDFWFTGCTWCSYLNAAMQTIINKYKNNKDVVFFTVSLDRNKTQWIKSVSSNIYTSSETINLYTNGLGNQDPVFQYYNFIGAPQQLIIGKKGDIVSSHPPRPDDNPLKKVDEIYERDIKTGIIKENPSVTLSNPNAIEFIKLIDSSLKLEEI